MGSITRYPLINSPFLREVKEDNQQLWHAVSRLRAIADIDLESEALCRELSMRLQWLREHLAIQFEIEETYGYLRRAPTSTIDTMNRLRKPDKDIDG